MIFLSVWRETYKNSKENVLRRLRHEIKWLESIEQDAQSSSDDFLRIGIYNNLEMKEKSEKLI